jgi:hypothetical protein
MLAPCFWVFRALTSDPEEHAVSEKRSDEGSVKQRMKTAAFSVGYWVRTVSVC